MNRLKYIRDDKFDEATGKTKYIISTLDLQTGIILNIKEFDCEDEAEGYRSSAVDKFSYK